MKVSESPSWLRIIIIANLFLLTLMLDTVIVFINRSVTFSIKWSLFYSYISHLTTVVLSFIFQSGIPFVHIVCVGAISVGSFSHRNKASLVRTVLALWSLGGFTGSALFQLFKMKKDLATCWGFHNNHNNYLNCSVTVVNCSYITGKKGFDQIAVEQSCINFCFGAKKSDIYQWKISENETQKDKFCLISIAKKTNHITKPLCRLRVWFVHLGLL